MQLYFSDLSIRKPQSPLTLQLPPATATKLRFQSLPLPNRQVDSDDFYARHLAEQLEVSHYGFIVTASPLRLNRRLTLNASAQPIASTTTCDSASRSAAPSLVFAALTALLPFSPDCAAPLRIR